MATAFDGIGLGQLGSESRYMHGDNPINDALKGIQDFAFLTAIDKSGLVGWLNSLGQQSQDLKDKYKTPAPVGAAVPDQPYAIKPIMAIDPNAMSAPYMQPPVISSQPTTTPVQQKQTEQKSLDDLADEAMNIKKSSITPDVMQTRNTSQDVVPMQSASAPHPVLQLPKYSGDISSILSLFLGEG